MKKTVLILSLLFVLTLTLNGCGGEASTTPPADTTLIKQTNENENKVSKENVDGYEKKFGEIKKPEVTKKAEKEFKKKEKVKPEKSDRPSYMG